MIGRAWAVAGVVGVSSAHGLAQLPSVPMLAGIGAGLLAVAGVFCWSGGRRRHPAWRGVLGCLLAGWVAFCVTVLWAHARLEQQVAESNVDRVARVVLRVEGLPKLTPDRVSFDARVLQAHPSGVPEHIRVSWPAAGGHGSPYAAPRAADPPFPEIYAGQRWRMALVLRPVRSAQNMHAFDYEQYAFAAGFRAQGAVRGTPEYLGVETWSGLSLVAGQARHHIREAMAPYLQGLRYGPVLRALAIGDQDGVSQADWEVFARSGILHLISVSGSHITSLAAVGGLATLWVWRRARWRGRVLAERWPARRAAACAALLVAWLYCLLAGWGIPAQRTFMMLAVAAGAQALQLRLSGSRILALAAVFVLALDPWAVLSSGFWLSFLAVGVLLAVAAHVGATHPQEDERQDEPPARMGRWLQRLRLATRLQLTITGALVPALAWLFHEVSWVSPLANAYAIPVVELVVTPLSLLLAGAVLIPGMEPLAQGLVWLAHAVLNAMMQPTEFLARWPAIAVPAAPGWAYGLAFVGVAVALWPRTASAWVPAGGGRYLPRQAWAWCALLPLLVWTPPTPAEGEWDLHALDVGQGSAVLLRTARHAVLFDTGARHARDVDEGARTLLPALRALGIARIDALVVSHADLDHAGGTRSVLAGLPVEQTFSSFDLPAWLQREARHLQTDEIHLPRAATPCVAGSRWQIDGVRFEFLWPRDIQAERPSRAANDASCVLRVEGAHHAVLFTGDIGKRPEAELALRGLPPADVVIVAHHGSRTSSSPAFVRAAGARHAILQVGRWNRHGHPHPAVVARWTQSGARIWRTDWQGGVNAQSRAQGLRMYSVLESSRRYWHGRRP